MMRAVAVPVKSSSHEDANSRCVSWRDNRVAYDVSYWLSIGTNVSVARLCAELRARTQRWICDHLNTAYGYHV